MCILLRAFLILSLFGLAGAYKSFGPEKSASEIQATMLKASNTATREFQLTV